MGLFKYYQPNKKDIKDNYGDCVIRALTKVLNMDWQQVFDLLVPIAKEFQCMPNTPIAYEKLLTNSEFVYTGISNKKGTKRPTVESFAKSHKQGTYILRVAHHIVALVDGIYYDTWNCGSKSLYGYWVK